MEQVGRYKQKSIIQLLIDDIDYAIKRCIFIPSFWLNMNSLLLPLGLVHINKEKHSLNIIKQKAIYLFEIRHLVQSLVKVKLQFKYFSPYLILLGRIIKNLLSQSKIFRNSCCLKQQSLYRDKKLDKLFRSILRINNKLQLKMFSYYPFDEIGQGLNLGQQKYQKKIKRNSNNIGKNYINKSILQSVIQSICYRNSLNCKVNFPFEYIKHIIDLKLMGCRKCKEQTYDSGSPFYDITLYYFFQFERYIIKSILYRYLRSIHLSEIIDAIRNLQKFQDKFIKIQ
ncbi:unnamed protein product [Paramecium sonneborni]|uniref:Uncharacterized protein n=1 Tax=Paramecium sonneborni TaxID=65129 RepID=A0A8S1NQL8_9CILI|nr:unnamed protein product [Paramecium sonneborni]